MLSESTALEFKREYTADIVKTVVAFANTGGGTIYIGMADDGSVVGVEDADETLLKLSNSVRDSIKPDVTMFVEYSREIIEDKPVVRAEVQKGTSCPYYLAVKGIRPEGVYVRQGASTVPATETAILRMIKETDGERYEDVRSLNQDLTFAEAEKEFAARNVPFGASQQKTLGLMNADGIYTNLGLLLSDQCPHSVKLAVFEGKVKAQFKDRREYNGSLLRQLNDVYEFIDRYNRNRSEIEGLHRIDRRDYPVEAVREALLNALVHRDYSFSDSTLISIFDDRIEFISIGGLARGITLDDMMLGISVARNRNLANVFYRLTLIEAYGTGMPKIMRSYESYPATPQIEVTDNAFKITLPNVNELDESAVLSENERVVMDLLAGRDSIARRDVEAALGISQAMAVRVLKGLVDKGELKAVGGGKNTRYVEYHTQVLLGGKKMGAYKTNLKNTDIYESDPDLQEHVERTMAICKRFVKLLPENLQIDKARQYEAACYHDIAKLDDVPNDDHNLTKYVEKSLNARGIETLSDVIGIIEAHKGEFEPPEEYEIEAAILRMSDKIDRYNKKKKDAAAKYESSLKIINKFLKEKGFSKGTRDLFKKVCGQLRTEVIDSL